jgi:predicted nuclease of predicted toxin-antitoxin system
MKLLADLHISPRTVTYLKSLHHDVVRVSDIMPVTSSDEQIVSWAREQGRVILTQDLDFTNIIALSGQTTPSLITLRLSSSRIEYVNERLSRILPEIEIPIDTGLLVTVDDESIRKRTLPVALR